MRDFYPADMALRNLVFDAWRTAAHRFGFLQYDSCVVESLDILKRKAGEEIVEQIYAFKDKSGRELALRPEMTPTLARMVAARQGALTFPVKWFAIAQCFRYERTTRGRKREHFQWNLDVVGEDSLLAEAEVMATAVEALRCMGLDKNDVVVDFSSRALLADVLRGMGIEESHHTHAFMALDKRGKLPDKEIEVLLSNEGLPHDGIQRIFDLLAVRNITDVAAILPPNTESYSNLLHFMGILESYGLRDTVNFNIGVIRGLSYYTGIVFEAFDVDRQLRAIFGGGRYDNLLGDIGGTPATAVGLGFGDVVVAELLAMKQTNRSAVSPGGIALGYMTTDQQSAAILAASVLRGEGYNVDLSMKPEKAKKFFARVGKSGFDEAAFIGPDDVAAGITRVKNLTTREEREVRR